MKDFTGNYMLNTAILVATWLSVLLLVYCVTLVLRRQRLIMLTFTEDSLNALFRESSRMMLRNLSAVQQVLERLQNAGKDKTSTDGIRQDLSQIKKVSEEVWEAKDFSSLLHTHRTLYSPLFDNLQKKYSALLPRFVIKQLMTFDNYMSTLFHLLSIEFNFNSAFQRKNVEHQLNIIYFGMSELTVFLEQHLPHLSTVVIDIIKGWALEVLNDSALNLDHSEKPSIFSDQLISLKNTARAVLYQLDEHSAKKSPNNWAERIRQIRKSESNTETDKLTYKQLLDKWRQEYTEEEMDESAEVISRAFDRDYPA